MVHEEAELANLAKQYLRDAIKQQCWDAMTVKGKVVKVSCKTINNTTCTCLSSNY